MITELWNADGHKIGEVDWREGNNIATVVAETSCGICRCPRVGSLVEVEVDRDRLLYRGHFYA